MKAGIKRCLAVFLMVMGMLLSAMTASAYQDETAADPGQPTVIEETSSVGTAPDAEGAADTENVVPEGADAAGTVTADSGTMDAGAQALAGETVLNENTSSAGGDPLSGENQAVGTVQGDGAGDTPFSIPGNGLLLDDKSEDGTKQFLTIRTKNGNTFFMVLDRSNNTENVYMLSMIDEDDLAEFIKDTKDQSKSEVPSLALPQKDTTPAAADVELESKKNKTGSEKQKTGGMSTGSLLALLALAAGGGGGFYYFKVVKPKKDGEDAEAEDLEFCDDGTYINEDQDGYDHYDEEGEDE